MIRRGIPGIPLFAALSLLFAGCEGPPTVPWRALSSREQNAPADAAAATLWVSYQIEIVKIDSRAADLRAPARGVYYKVLATPGEHELTLRLNYKAPIHEVRSEVPATIHVRLEAGREYRLLDLAAGIRRDRKFTPWLQPGAPPQGDVTATKKSPYPIH